VGARQLLTRSYGLVQAPTYYRAGAAGAAWRLLISHEFRAPEF
jgi:hypothetical protein